MTEARIIVIDDEDAGRYVKVQTLRRAGFTVCEGATGAEALELAARERPDVIVLDVNLPDISGVEVTRRLRAGEEPPALQILQISNTAVGTADRVRGLEQGADVYLTEPVDGAVLVATVHSLLRVRRAEAALAAALDGERQAREIAEQANRLKDEFIATLSHELRTPLNALMGWVWQLRNTSLSPAAQERALDSVERNARMQAQLINDLLDVSRASRGKLQLEIRIVDLPAAIAAAIDSVRGSVAQKNLEVRTDLAPVWVAGDESRLQQIVTNLLTNAVQFTPEGGRILVSLTAGNGDAVLAVQDTGAGIDPAFLPHVFEQFRQGEGNSTRKHGGLGLGLSVVKQLIDLHAGSVDVASPGPGQGATFTVRLPREAMPSHASGSAGRGLLLEGVRVALFAIGSAGAQTLESTLVSAGARVKTGCLTQDEPVPTSVSDADVIVGAAGHGPLTYRVPDSVAPKAEWQTLAPTAPPVEIVRRIAKVTTLARTP